jgi:LacI family repressor for deo operon, udp, cdd, tsx, nupC, and nupG
VAGYEEALRQAQIPLDDALVSHGDFTLKAGYLGASAMLKLNPRPTALFCENDEMAIGALRRIREEGLRVPQDISLAGFDDIPMAAYCDPALTTISQPAEAFGEKAVEMLIALMDGKPVTERHLVLPFELTVRESTGAPSRKD